MRIATIAVWGVLLAATTAGCGSKASNACERVKDLCSNGGPGLSLDVDASDVEGCAKDMPKLRDKLGDEGYDKLMSCMTSANTCAELAGCAVGTVSHELEKATGELQRGFDKTK